MGTEEKAALGADALGYGMAPVAATGVVTLLCALGLLIGAPGIIAKATASPPPEAPLALATVETDSTSPNGTADGTGTSTAGPIAPPERESAPEKIQPSDTVHYIVWGDTLSQISVDTGVSVGRLADYNAIPNVDLIYADSLLNIPYILIPEADAPSPSEG